MNTNEGKPKKDGEFVNAYEELEATEPFAKRAGEKKLNMEEMLANRDGLTAHQDIGNIDAGLIKASRGGKKAA